MKKVVIVNPNLGRFGRNKDMLESLIKDKSVSVTVVSAARKAFRGNRKIDTMIFLSPNQFEEAFWVIENHPSVRVFLLTPTPIDESVIVICTQLAYAPGLLHDLVVG